MKRTTRVAVYAVGFCIFLDVALASTACGSLSGSITGRVFDQDGSPVTNASVLVLGKQRGTLTDSTGSFTIADVPAGDFTLRVIHLGFSRTQSSVRVSAGRTETVNFRIERYGFESEPPRPPQYVASGREPFALTLCRELSSVRGNLFLSPWSIRRSLDMAYEGARTHTRASMARVLGYEATSPEGRQRSREGTGVPPLVSANAVWVGKDLPLEPAYPETLVSRYGAPPSRIDFANASAAREAINAWVENQTGGRIHALVPTDGITSATALALVNAAYFRAAWATPFHSSATSPASFYGDEGKVFAVPFMRMDRELRIFEDREVQVLELPYAHSSSAMLILLPRDPAKIAALESKADTAALRSWISHLKPAFVRVALPKFRIDTSYRLSAVLRQMGMGDAFTSSADFTGISRAKPLYLDEVFHKAYVQIDEQGTEAATATAVAMTKGSIAIPTSAPIVFLANHPFLFLIRSGATGDILFMGRLVDPS